ncbi:hypothetical protein INR49_022636 [Caranx melampygus]|nr:hypothetical protein INR49_022636 [Caranx melampygus]
MVLRGHEEDAGAPELLDPGGAWMPSTHTLPSPHESYHYGLGYTSPFSSQQRPQRHSMYVIPTRASSLQLLSPQLQHRTTLTGHSVSSSREDCTDDMTRVGMYHDPHGEDGGSSKENRMIFTESMPRRSRHPDQITPPPSMTRWAGSWASCTCCPGDPVAMANHSKRQTAFDCWHDASGSDTTCSASGSRSVHARSSHHQTLLNHKHFVLQLTSVVIIIDTEGEEN